MKILAVDDDPDFLAIFEMLLKDLGYSDVTLAVSGEDALWKIAGASKPFDCFILDIQMPGIDGIELCRRIRALPEYQDTPITMNTVVSDRDHIDRAFAVGATDYLTKPINEVEIQARLGVLQKLVDARRKQQARSTEQSVSHASPPTVGFMDSVPMKRVDGAIDQIALCNYIQTLGFFRSRSIALVAVQVTNARHIHEMDGGAVFGEVMIDVATCLSDSLNCSPKMIAYLGGGTFVCLLPRDDALRTESLSQNVSRYVMEFETVYGELDITLPNIEVGPPLLCRPVHVKNPSRALEEVAAAFRSTHVHFPVERLA
ncbi:response regulator [Rhodobacterales bacterium HKCCE4037]|nr:response regulator [Rhodobacterales bacterium HKCCE4037]